MNRKLLSLVMVLVLALTACMGRPASDAIMEPGYDYYPVEAPSAPPEPQRSALEQEMGWATDDAPISNDNDIARMIVYNGELTLVVKDSSEAQGDITQMITALGGYVSASTSSIHSGGLLRINLTARVPAGQFHAVMDSLRDMAIEITRESIYTEDVTQEYVDLGSRLTALEAKAVRLEELMEEAEDTEAVLAVYNELSRTQQDIEHVKGRMRYLERTSAMATITVILVPDALSQPIEIAGWRPQGTVRRAIEALIQTFQWLVDALIWIVLLIVPVLVFIGFVTFGFIWLLRNIFFRRKKKDDVPKKS